MKLAIVGYGKWGRLMEQLAPEYGFTVDVVKIDVNDSLRPLDRRCGDRVHHARGRGRANIESSPRAESR